MKYVCFWAGVYLCKHADIITAEPMKSRQAGMIFLFKFIKVSGLDVNPEQSTSVSFLWCIGEVFKPFVTVIIVVLGLKAHRRHNLFIWQFIVTAFTLDSLDCCFHVFTSAERPCKPTHRLQYRFLIKVIICCIAPKWLARKGLTCWKAGWQHCLNHFKSDKCSKQWNNIF